MAFDIAHTLATLPPVAAPGAPVAAAAVATPGAAATPRVELGPGVSLNDLGAFEQALASVRVRAGEGASLQLAARPVDGPSQAAQALWQPFSHINGEAATLGRDARAAAAEGRELTPGELMSLTVRCQEFMFHCQLTSNIANRTAEGLQQLFRQQS